MRLTQDDIQEVFVAAESKPCCDYQDVLKRLRKMNHVKPSCSERYPFILSKAEDVIGKKLTSARSANNTLIRCFVAYKMHQEGYSLSDIGRQMSRDHSTVTNLVHRVRDMLSLPNAYKWEVQQYKRFEELL